MNWKKFIQQNASTLVIWILNGINSIRFWNELSLVIKNGLFTIMSFENDHGPSVMNHQKQHWKLNCIKKILCCLFGGLLLSAKQIERSVQRKTARIGQSQRCNFSPCQRYTTHIFSHSPKMIKAWFSFLPIKTRSSMSVELRSYQKDGKSSLNKIENISLIKVYSLYLKKCV